MKKLVAGLALVVGLASVALAWDQVNTSVDGLNVKGSSLAIDGVKVTATAAQLNAAGTKAATAVTGASLTQSKAAITATAAIQGVTYNVIDKDGATNSMVSPTNIVVTIVNGGAVCTNVSISLTQ